MSYMSFDSTFWLRDGIDIWTSVVPRQLRSSAGLLKEMPCARQDGETSTSGTQSEYHITITGWKLNEIEIRKSHTCELGEISDFQYIYDMFETCSILFTLSESRKGTERPSAVFSPHIAVHQKGGCPKALPFHGSWIPLPERELETYRIL